MKTFNYERAADFQDAGQLKTKYKNAEFIAGGTDLLGKLKKEILPEQPETLIDLKSIADARGIKVENGVMSIGALTSLTAVCENEEVKKDFPMLAEAAHSVATPIIRNSATIGGNICQDVRCWFYRYPNEASGRLNCARKCGEECYAIHGENRYHSIFGGYKICTSQCTKTCPAATDIPAYMAEIRKGNWDAAAEIIMRVNPMPMITARICPHPCEDDCNQGKHGESVSIHNVERAAGDYILKNKHKFYTAPETETGKKIPIIGSAPSGLCCAYYLRKMGHSVTIIDKMEKPGGVLVYGIPHYRLPKTIVQQFADALADMGIHFQMNTEVGKDVTMEQITASYDNVFIGTGAWKQPILGIHGEELTQFGLDFLVEVNKYLEKVASFGENILVCGGGNVAMDVALTAVRLGAKKVTMCCLEKEYEMPASREEIERAREEGIEIINSRGLNGIIEKDGKVTGLETKKCISVFDEKGRFHPSYDENDKSVIAADTIILAIGQKVDLDFLGEKFASEIKSARGLIEADEETYKTAMPHVYGAGDAVTGPNLAIRAVAGGAAAARSINRELGFTSANIENEHGVLSFDPEGVGIRKANKSKERPVKERALDLEDSETFTDSETSSEASRCMNCGCYAVSPSDIAPVLIALNARIVTVKGTIDAETFFCTSPKTTDMLDKNEAVTKILIPLDNEVIGEYRKFRLRNSVDFAIVSAARAIKLEAGRVSDARLVFGGVSPMPRRAFEVEDYLKGKEITEATAEKAAELAVKDAIPLQYNAYKIVELKSLVKDTILAAR